MFNILAYIGVVVLIALILWGRKRLLRGRDLKEHASNLRDTIDIAKEVPKDLTQKTVDKAKDAVDKFHKTQ